jgi:hypothetical protein
MSNTVRLTKVLEHYDGPVLFEGRDSYGGHYIGVAVQSEGPGDLFAVVGVEPDRLRRFRNGSLDLLALMTEREDPTWFIGTQRMDGSDVFDIAAQTRPLAETDYLPERGFFLHDRPAKSEVVVAAREYNHLVMEVSVEPPEASSEHRIQVDTLSKLLGHVQTIVKHAFNRSIRGLSSSSRGGTDFRDAHMLDVLVPAASGSFKVVLGVSKEPQDLFHHSEITRGLALIDELFSEVADPTKDVEIARNYKGHLAGAYLRLLKFLDEKDTGLRYSWAEPSDDTPKSFSISRSQLRPLIDELSKVASLGTETVVLTGVVEKVDAKAGTWRLITDEGPVNGKRHESGPGLGGVVIKDKRYRFTCEEQLEAQEVSQGEKKTLYLLELEVL